MEMDLVMADAVEVDRGDGDAAASKFSTARFGTSVTAITKENTTARFNCEISLVHNDKTVFLKNQAFEEIKPTKTRRVKPKLGSKAKVGKTKKPVKKPGAIKPTLTIQPKLSTLRPILPTKPILPTTKPVISSKVSCTPDKPSATVVDFNLVKTISSADSSTNWIFTLTLTTNPDIIKSATVRTRTIDLIKPQEIIDQLGLSSEIENLENLTPANRKELNAILEESIFQNVRHENRALLMKFKKSFIQFNNKTDQLGQNARLFATLEAAINSFKTAISKEKVPDAALESDINQLLNVLSENCANSTDGFEGTDPSEEICNPCDKYRRIDGICNNFISKGFGAAGIPLRRLLPNAYNDGFSIPRGGFSSTLPSPRLISAKLHHHPISVPNSHDTPLTNKGFTHMAMQFGQFLDHDITLSAQQELDCCDLGFLKQDLNMDHVQRRCFNIDVKGDSFYKDRIVDCHSFTRSDFICSMGDVREQINGITAFIDASNVYGSDTVRASKLRDPVDKAKLKENTAQPPGHLPTRAQCGLGPGNPDDLVAGDVRANVQPTLASTHTLFLNEHNRIVMALRDEANIRGGSFLNGLTSTQQDDILYEEARKIVGATLQNIVYEEYVPIILGSGELSAQGLGISGSSTYDDHLDPSILNEFATVAYRFGHSLIDGIFNRDIAPWSLRRHYFDNTDFSSNNQWKREMDGVIKQQCPARDLLCTHDVTNFLFQNHNLMPPGTGDDLIARNIQRGRDHGIPSYRKLRSFCNLTDLAETAGPPLPPPEINSIVWNDILGVYSNVDDIDAFTGGLAEEAPADGLVGPTFACIIGRQFKRLMFGDRFFFTHTSGSAHVRGLLPKSKATVRKRTLGDVICDNAGGVGGIQTSPTLHVMKEESETNPQIKCKDRVPLNISDIVDDIETFNPCTTTPESTTITTSATTESTTHTTTESTTHTTTESTTHTTTESTTHTTTDSTTITTESTTITTESSTKKTEHFQPLPGYCATKSSEVVDYDQEWNNECQDIKGNLYAQDQFLISCCGCFKIICNSTQPSVYSRHIVDKVFFWNKTVEAQCCQDCHGKVFAGGSIMNTEVLDDKCSTTVTTRCVFIGNNQKINKYLKMADGKLCSGTSTRITTEEDCKAATASLSLTWAASWNGPRDFPGCLHANDGRNKVYFNKSPTPSSTANNPKYAAICRSGISGQENRAIAEMLYNHRNCCSDENGLHTTGSTIDVPKTCSKRTCHREDGQLFSSWISNQVESGCNCCQLPSICSEPKVTCSAVEGTLMEDGGVLRVDLGYPNQPINLKCCQGKFVEDFKSG